MERIREIISNAKNMDIMDRDINALIISYNNYMDDTGELNESLFGYMRSYILGNEVDKIIYKDEIENILGISNHEEIISIIV